MTVFLWGHKLTYVSVPKVACTSLKNMFYTIENGSEFKAFIANGKRRHIHNAVYPGLPFAKLPHARIADHRRLAVVRDPVDRFLSCYSNRVLFHGALSHKKAGVRLRQLDLAETPPLDEYIAKFEIYRTASPEILHHSQPLSFNLGRDPDYFSRIYTMKELPDFVRDVIATSGVQAELGHLQAGGRKIGRDELSAAQLARVRAFYAEDYEIFAAHLGR